MCAAQGNPHTQGNAVEAMVVVLGSVMVLGMCVAVGLKTVLVYQVRLCVCVCVCVHVCGRDSPPFSTSSKSSHSTKTVLVYQGLGFRR